MVRSGLDLDATSVRPHGEAISSCIFLSMALREGEITNTVNLFRIVSASEVAAPRSKILLVGLVISTTLFAATACSASGAGPNHLPGDTPSVPGRPHSTTSASVEPAPSRSAEISQGGAKYSYVSGQVIRSGIDKGDVSDIYNRPQGALIPEINGTNGKLFENHCPVAITESQIRSGRLPQEYGERVAPLVSGYYSTKGGTFSSDMSDEEVAAVAPDRASYLLCALGAKSRTDASFTDIYLKTPYGKELFSPKILSPTDFSKVEAKLGRKEVKPESTVLFGANETVIDLNGVAANGDVNIYIRVTGLNMYDGDALRAAGADMTTLKDSGLPLIGATIQVQGRLVPSGRGDDYEFRGRGINILGGSNSLVRNPNETIGNDGKLKKLDKYGNPVQP